MRYRNTIKGNPECQKCDGTGEVDGPMVGTFNVSRMEQGFKETKELCECAEVIEPDWDAIRDARDER